MHVRILVGVVNQYAILSHRYSELLQWWHGGCRYTLWTTEYRAVPVHYIIGPTYIYFTKHFGYQIL